MKDIIVDGIPFEFKGKEYNIKMNLLILRNIQKKFDCSIFEIGNFLDINSPLFIDNLAFIMADFINEAILLENKEKGESNPLLTEDEVLRDIPPSDFGKCVNIVVRAIQASFPKGEEESPN